MKINELEPSTDNIDTCGNCYWAQFLTSNNKQKRGTCNFSRPEYVGGEYRRPIVSFFDFSCHLWKEKKIK